MITIMTKIANKNVYKSYVYIYKAKQWTMNNKSRGQDSWPDICIKLA